MAIDLSPSESQVELQRVAHDFFADRCPPAVVREIEEQGIGYQPAMWQEMAERGWLGLGLPTAYGGSEGGFLDLYALYEEMGRFLVPSPHLDTVVIAGDVLARGGGGAQGEEVLRAIVQGECIVSLAILEASGGFGPSAITMAASRRGNSFILSGTKLLVGFATSANHLLCVARTSQAGAKDGVTLFLVDAGASGISSIPLQNIAGGALYHVEFDQVPVSTANVVGDIDAGWALVSPAITKAAVLQTASIVGAARAVLDRTNQYAKDREQFGRPIGAYQAVQYMVTDILIAMHSADLLAKQAAYRIDAGKPFGREAAMAIAYGKKAAAHLHRQAHEVHAGVGFMVEHDLNLYSRRSKFWENNLGDSRYHQEQVAGYMSR